MSPIGIASTLLGLIQSAVSTSSSTSNQAATARSGSIEEANFSSSLTLRMAALQAQSVTGLLGSLPAGGKASSAFDFLGTMQTAGSAAIPGLSATGRNLTLFDPESAYRMMTAINNGDVTYKAQFSELSEMKTAVTGMQQAGLTLGAVSESLDDAAIKTQLQTFAAKYNEWIGRFDGTVQGDGLLAGTQAATISLYELKQSVENIFNGAKGGFHGLRDLGLSIDPKTNLAVLDTAKLDSVLGTNRQGAIGTITEFGANFARSAELLNSANNFIPNRLANLDRVIDYIGENKPALQAEFGLGNPATPSAQVARALAAYNQNWPT